MIFNLKASSWQVEQYLDKLQENKIRVFKYTVIERRWIHKKFEYGDVPVMKFKVEIDTLEQLVLMQEILNKPIILEKDDLEIYDDWRE